MKKLKTYWQGRVYCQNRDKYKCKPEFCDWLKSFDSCIVDQCEFCKDLVYDDNHRITHIYCSCEPKK